MSGDEVTVAVDDAPPCALCSRPATTADWCAGCASSICQACDSLLTVREARARHPPLSHLAWIHDQVEDRAAEIVRALREGDAAKRRASRRFIFALCLVEVVAVVAWLWLRGRLRGG